MFTAMTSLRKAMCAGVKKKRCAQKSKEGETSIEDEPCSVRPSTATEEISKEASRESVLTTAQSQGVFWRPS